MRECIRKASAPGPDVSIPSERTKPDGPIVPERVTQLSSFKIRNPE